MRRLRAACDVTTPCLSRRATILLSVLVVVVIGTLIGTTMTMIAGAQRVSVESAGKRAQSRALALSGLRAVVAELNDQRRELLRGEEPRLTGEWTLFEARDGSSGVIRLLPLGPDEERCVSESAKLDVNSHTAETLARLPGIDEALAQKLATRAKAQPFTSLGGLLEVEGVTPDQLHISTARGRADFTRAEGFARSASDAGGEAGDATLADHLTVFAFDPNVQTGLQANRPDQFLGRRRINLNREWSEELERAIQRRYDEDLANAVRGAMRAGVTFPDDARMMALLADSPLEATYWGALLDGFTAWREPYHYGKVDINRAPAEVLAALPGLDAEVAADIVDVRRQLGEQDKRSVAWPVVEEIMTAEQFREAGPWLATRSMQWRVRIMGGFLPPRPGGGAASPSLPGVAGAAAPQPAAAAPSGDSSGEGGEEALQQAVILEAVIDVAGPTPRIAYLRDLTLYETAARVRTAALEAREDEYDAFAEPEGEFAVSAAGEERRNNGAEEAELEGGFWPESDNSADTETGDNPPPIGEDGADRPSAGADTDEPRSEGASARPPRPRSNRDRRIGRWRG